MKEQLGNVVLGIAGQLAYSDVIKASDSDKNEMIKIENWEFKGANSALVILNEMKYLFEYTPFFIQIQLTLKNNVVVRIDTITDVNKRIDYNA